MDQKLDILTLNIGNPSIERAKRQVSWLELREEDVFILTETKNGEGCNYIEEYFSQYGMNLFSWNSDRKYYVYFPKSSTGDLGVMIISRQPLADEHSIFPANHNFFSRFASCDLHYKDTKIRIIGLYVPSRDRSEEKINRKKRFCIDVANHIKSLENKTTIICGDLNVVSKNHYPHYSTFLDWEYNFYDFFERSGYIDGFAHCHPDQNEYSWVGRTNDGYRYDYCFASKSLLPSVVDCCFLHETRMSSLTDHSGIMIRIR